MAELRELKNSCLVQGVLMDNTLEVKVDSKGKRYISGNLEIKTSDDTIIPINTFAYELKSNGDKSKLYDTAAQMMEWPSVRTAGIAHAPSVAIKNATLESNNFYSMKDDKVINGWRIRGGFASMVAPDAPGRNEFEIEGIIASIKEIIDKEGESTNAYQLKLFNVGYGGKKVNDLTFTFDDPKAIEYITSNYNVGDLITINGKIEYEQKKKVVKKEFGFGEPLEQTYTNIVKMLKITAGSQPISIDEHGIALKDLQTIVISQNNAIEEKAKTKTTNEVKNNVNLNNLLF